MKRINKFLRWLKIFFVSLVYGLKNTEIDILSSKTNSSEPISINQNQEVNKLGEALLKGEVTEEVEMLRDRIYWVSEESHKYELIINTTGVTKARKKEGLIHKTPTVFNEGDFNIEIVMNNFPVSAGVSQSKPSYPLNFEYIQTPKFILEQYVNKLVLRSKNSYLFIDLYVPKHTDSYNRLERMFSNEINKIKLKKSKSQHVKFDVVKFISQGAYGVEDLIPFTFKMIDFVSIAEYNEYNVLTYEVKQIERGEKLTNKYINKKLRDGYASGKKRNEKATLNVFNHQDVSYCSRCNSQMNEYDSRIIKHTTGRYLCPKCLLDEVD